MRMPRDRSFYIPRGATKVVSKDAPDAVVHYVANPRGWFHAVGFRGKAFKPAFNYTFKTQDNLVKYVEQFFKNCADINAYKTKRREERKSAGAHTLNVGDILYSSWGYDQTNVDFYQIVELVGKATAVLRKVAQDRTESAWMQGKCVARPGEFVGEPFRKRISPHNSVTISSCQHAYKWDGREVSWSSYA